MSREQRFGFSSAEFSNVSAHAGEGLIEAARVLERASGPLRFVDLVRIPPGHSIGVHRHASDEELYILISGSGRMKMAGEEFEVSAGDVVLNPPQGVHGMVNTGDEMLLLVVVDVDPHEG